MSQSDDWDEPEVQVIYADPVDADGNGHGTANSGPGEGPLLVDRQRARDKGARFGDRGWTQRHRFTPRCPSGRTTMPNPDLGPNERSDGELQHKHDVEAPAKSSACICE